jgi:tetratricopeptide (TPR) repeat protein
MTDLQRLRDLFDAMLDVPSERWDDFFEDRALDAATRSELRRLAAADESGEGLLDVSIGAMAQAFGGDPRTVAPDPTGRRIGPFRIVRRLGEGGMASVYLAQREGADFDQAVALKLLRHGALSEIEQRFFRRERQVLARLSHPNIARLIDGGVDEEGVPYLAMEYVEGTSITRWCREHACDAAQRVALVAKVARAVAAAHAALVVHRDIKPSNVLVDADGEPRLLDFGIAKLLESEGGERTRSGLAPMTPEYAAPEQFDRGAITTATDVYSLGVLLYELLTGARPVRGAARPPSSEQAPRGRAARDGAITRRVRGDLDTVVLMALAEDPAQRYPGAAALADDLERYLANQPVLAHPPSAWYRTRKFVRRHRGGVALTALLLLGILASLASALWQARIARQEAARARQVQEFLIGAVEAARAVQPRAERPGIDDVVEAAAHRLENDETLDLRTRAELLLALGKVAMGAADLERAAQMFERARVVAQELPARDPVQWPLRLWQARLVLARSDTAATFALLDEAAALPGTPPVADRLDAQLLRANALYVAGHPDESVRVAEDVIASADRELGASDPAKALELRFACGDLLAIAQKYRRAIEVLRVGVERHRALGLRPQLSYMSALAGLAQAEARVGNLDVALQDAERALTLSREIFEPPHAHIARALSTLGVVQNARGQTAASAQAFGEALEMRRELLGRDDPNLIPALINVGAIEGLLGRHDAALELFLEAERLCAKSPASTRATCGLVRHRIAATQQKLGRLDEAEHGAQASLALRREVYGEDSGEVAAAHALLANIARESRRTDLALERSAAAERILERRADISRNIRAEVGIARVRALLAHGDADDALARNEELLAWWREDSPDEKQFLAQMLADRSAALRAAGRRDEAVVAAREARALGLSPAELGAQTDRVLSRALGDDVGD